MPQPDLETIMPILMGIWRRRHKLSGPSDSLQTREFRTVVEAVQQLRKGLEDGKDLIGTDYFSDPNLLGAYLLYYWVVHYQQGLSLINELPREPGRVLDICSGLSPFGFAALRHGAREVVALDRSGDALAVGAEVCGRYGFPLTIRKDNCRNSRFPVDGKFDLIIVAHSMEELFHESQKNWYQEQKAWLNQVSSLLTPEGHLLIVENSSVQANRRVLSIREEFVKAGTAVQAPCVWKGECPALQTRNSPCYAQREFEKPYIIKEIQRAAGINLSSLKMSYVILKAPGTAWPKLPERPLYRVISPPVESSAGKLYYLCGTDGKKTLSSQTAECPREARAFEFLKRGELISIGKAVERQSRLEIVAGTEVRVEAAIGKPLPEPEYIEKNP